MARRPGPGPSAPSGDPSLLSGTGGRQLWGRQALLSPSALGPGGHWESPAPAPPQGQPPVSLGVPWPAGMSLDTCPRHHGAFAPSEGPCVESPPLSVPVQGGWYCPSLETAPATSSLLELTVLGRVQEVSCPWAFGGLGHAHLRGCSVFAVLGGWCLRADLWGGLWRGCPGRYHPGSQAPAGPGTGLLQPCKVLLSKGGPFRVLGARAQASPRGRWPNSSHHGAKAFPAGHGHQVPRLGPSGVPGELALTQSTPLRHRWAGSGAWGWWPSHRVWTWLWPMVPSGCHGSRGAQPHSGCRLTGPHRVWVVGSGTGGGTWASSLTAPPPRPLRPTRAARTLACTGCQGRHLRSGLPQVVR